MAFQPRRHDRPSHLSVVRDADDRPQIHTTLSSMLERASSLGQEEVDLIAAGVGPAGSDGSAAMEALVRAVAGAGRIPEWDEVYRRVCDTLERTGLERTYAITPAFLAASFHDLIGTEEFTVEHYDAMTSSWRSHVGRIHPEDESLKEGEPPVFGCGPREFSGEGLPSWQDLLRGPHT